MSKLYRVKCGACGEVQDIAAAKVCSKCGKEIEVSAGAIQLYRMGSPVGVAAGFGIYINGQPYGHIGNKETFRIALPYGKYTVHCTCGMTRKCNDLTVELTPESPIAYAKASIKMGFWANSINIETAKAEDMPEL